MKYTYFVSFVRTDPFSFGNIYEERESPLDEDGVRGLEKRLRGELGGNVVIINYILAGEEKKR